MPDLPDGTVTLVFTDVEGSTQLVRQLGDAFAQLLGDHRRLLREAVEQAQGHVVDHRGDEFFMVFDDPCRAAEAITAAQQAFATHSWPEGVELRVRVGLHTASRPSATGPITASTYTEPPESRMPEAVA